MSGYIAISVGFAHNCIVIDGTEQMIQGTRFQWFGWAKAKTLVHDVSEPLKVFVGQMPYRKIMTHYRMLCGVGITYGS